MDRKQVPISRWWPIIVKELSLDAGQLLRRAQLREDLFACDPCHVTVPEYLRLWQSLEDEANDPLLPLTLGTLSTSQAFEPEIFAAMCSPNLRVAARRVAQYKRLKGPMHMIIEDTDDGFYVGVAWDDPEIQAPATLGIWHLVSSVGSVRLATRERLCPLAVESPYAFEPRAAYSAFFGVQPKLSGRHGLMFSHVDADRPFMTADPAMWDVFQPELQRRLSKLDQGMPLADRLRSVLLECIPSGEVGVAEVARRLGLSSRTLQRRLKAEDVSFTKLLAQTRRDLAQHYVTQTRLSYAEIAFLIGFEEVSSFFRAFRDWTGQTPDMVRQGS